MAPASARQDRDALACVAHVSAERGLVRWSTPESMARMDTLIAEMQRDRAASPDSNKLYRGTGYPLALGTGTLGMRLEKAGIAGMITSRTKFSGFPNPFPAADNGRGRGGFGGRGTPGPASARGGGGPGASITAGGTEPADGGGRGGRGGGRGGGGTTAAAVGGRSRSSRPTTRSRRP